MTDDLDGNSRPAAGAYSIGCYEAAGSGPAQTNLAASSFTVINGKAKSGDLSSLAAADHRYLKIKAVAIDGNFGDIVEYDFQASPASASSIAITSISHPSLAPQHQQILALNLADSTWDVIDQRGLTTTSDSTTIVALPSPALYISATGVVRIRIRTGDTGESAWKHFIDFVQLTITQ